MKKTLAVVLAALLSVACLATIGSAATSASLNADYTGVSLLEDSDNLSVLFDGDKYEDAGAWGSAEKGRIVAFGNANCTDADSNTDLALIINLGEEKTISSMTVSFYKEYNVMIGYAETNEVTISSSDDGETFTDVDTFNFTSEACTKDDGTPNTAPNGVFDVTFTFDAPVTTSYLQIKIPYAANPGLDATGKKPIWEFMAMTEIALTEGEPADEDSSSEAPVESTEAPVESSETESSETESSTPSTGDAGIVAVAAVALIAIAGAAVVIKKRA